MKYSRGSIGWLCCAGDWERGRRWGLVVSGGRVLYDYSWFVGFAFRLCLLPADFEVTE